MDIYEEIDALRASIHELTKESDKWHEKYEQQRDYAFKLSRERDQSTRDLSLAIKNYGALQLKYDELEEENNSTNRRVIQLETKSINRDSSWVDKIRVLENENISLRVQQKAPSNIQMALLENQIESLEVDNKQLTSTNNVLGQDIDELSIERDKLLCDVALYRNQYRQVKLNYHEVVTEKKSLRERIKELEKDKELLVDSRNHLQDDNARLESQLEDVKDLLSKAMARLEFK